MVHRQLRLDARTGTALDGVTRDERKRGGLWRAIALAALLLAGCGSVPEIAPSEQPLSSPLLLLLGQKGLEVSAPLFIRIFKEESELELWKGTSNGAYVHFKTYPICARSGELGPKLREGDKQAPEGFYEVTPERLNPNSKLYLSFNLGYPNAFDRANGRTGTALMVHGRCSSAGCYAMTDALIEEIYALLREGFRGGQQIVAVHAFPFRMTEEKLARQRNSVHYPFWRDLKRGYDAFEATRSLPRVIVCEKRYLINPRWRGGEPLVIDPQNRCPAHDLVAFDSVMDAGGARGQ